MGYSLKSHSQSEVTEVTEHSMHGGKWKSRNCGLRCAFSRRPVSFSPSLARGRKTCPISLFPFGHVNTLKKEPVMIIKKNKKQKKLMT